MKKINAAVIGCGLVAQKRHLPILNKLRDKIEIKAICDTNEKLLSIVGDKYNIKGRYDKLSDMFSHEDIDFVNICTPPKTHLPISINAIENNCNILLEKPMAYSSADCDKIIKSARKNNVKLGVIHNQLFNPPILKARKIMEKKEFGNFVGMRLLMHDPRDLRILDKNNWVHGLPSGVLSETGPHAIYLSLSFIGKVKNVEIFARNYLNHPWAPHDDFRIYLEGKNSSSNIVISYTSPKRGSYCDLLSTEETLKMDLLSMLVIREKSDGSMNPRNLAIRPLNNSFQTIAGVFSNSIKMFTGRIKLGHEIIIEKFIDSIIFDKTPPVTGEEGRDTIKTMELITSKYKRKYKKNFEKI